jgi:hypothetical protein
MSVRPSASGLQRQFHISGLGSSHSLLKPRGKRSLASLYTPRVDECSPRRRPGLSAATRGDLGFISAGAPPSELEATELLHRLLDDALPDSLPRLASRKSLGRQTDQRCV